MNNKVVLFNKCEKKCLIVVYLIIMCSFFSCSNLLMNNELAHVKEDKCCISFSISSENNSTSRTILPKEYNEAELANLFYKIKGRSTRGETLETDFYQIANSTGTINVSCTLWELSLELYQKSGESHEILMKDTILEDFTNGTTSISFNLSEKNINTQGGCSLSVYFADTQNIVHKILVELLDISTGATKVFQDFSIDESQKSVQFVKSKIDNGQYILKISFYNSMDELITTWCDILCVATGRTTTAEIDISESYLGSVPIAPEKLTAEVNENSVNLSWEDKSDNETQFNIYVYDNTDNLIETYYAFAGETSYTLMLESGTYKIGISAKNRIGESNKSILDYSIKVV